MRHDMELWSPLTGLSSLQRGIDRLFDDFSSRSTGVAFSPACDIEETDSEYMLAFDLPGVAKEDVKIEAVDNTLLVSGERRSERTEKKKASHFSERTYGAFQRVFTLPSGIDADKIEADYRDGVLRVLVPKSERAKSRAIPISEGKRGGLLDRIGGAKHVESKPVKEGEKKAA